VTVPMTLSDLQGL